MGRAERARQFFYDTPGKPTLYFNPVPHSITMWLYSKVPLYPHNIQLFLPLHSLTSLVITVIIYFEWLFGLVLCDHINNILVFIIQVNLKTNKCISVRDFLLSTGFLRLKMVSLIISFSVFLWSASFSCLSVSQILAQIYHFLFYVNFYLIGSVSHPPPLSQTLCPSRTLCLLTHRHSISSSHPLYLSLFSINASLSSCVPPSPSLALSLFQSALSFYILLSP